MHARTISQMLTVKNAESAAPDSLPVPAGMDADAWQSLQAAGAGAARRLEAILTDDKAFARYPPTTQARLIELSLTRAYGAPVSRSVAVTVSSDSADAVAASLDALSAALPERRPRPPADDAEIVTPGARPASRRRRAQ
jgi:hypothetical protein